MGCVGEVLGLFYIGIWGVGGLVVCKGILCYECEGILKVWVVLIGGVLCRWEWVLGKGFGWVGGGCG